MAEKKGIYLCLAHMSDEGIEQKYIKIYQRGIRHELGGASWSECEWVRERPRNIRFGCKRAEG